MRHTGGWIKLHRKVESSWIGNDASTFLVFTTLLTWANHTDSKIISYGKLITINRGQLITSVQELAKKWGLSSKIVERRLKLLESDGSIVQKVSNRGRIITICNYEEYQGSDSESGEQKGNRGSTRGYSRGETEGVHNEEYKKNKEDKEVKNIYTAQKNKISPSDFDYELSKEWIKWNKTNYPSSKTDLEKAADTIRKLRTNEKQSEQSLKKLFEFVKADDFWSNVARTPTCLLKRSKTNDMRKFENILVSMSRSKKVYQISNGSNPDDELAEIHNRVNQQMRAK